jgi:hypothetical protein
MSVWRSGSEREEMVGRGGIGLRYCTAAAVTSNAICRQIGGSILLQRGHQRRNCTIRKMSGRAVQKLKDSMLCSNTSFQRTL